MIEKVRRERNEIVLLFFPHVSSDSFLPFSYRKMKGVGNTISNKFIYYTNNIM